MAQCEPLSRPPFSAHIANARGNIPQHLSTARQRLTGGHWHPTEVTGETASFDDIGRLLASIYGIQYGRSSETRHHYVAAYGLESKKDPGALRKYCQFVEACGGTCSLRKM
jgi:hypothetical protein